MAIEHRNGLSIDFEKSKTRPCEINIVRDTQEVFVTFDAGNVKQMATKEDFQADINEIQELKESTVIAVEKAESLVVNKAGINDSTPTLTEAYSGAKTEQIIADAKSYADGLFGSIVEFNIEVVEELPTENIQTHTIYLVAKKPKPSEAYDEYLYIDSAWEHIGTTDIDLSGYYTKEEAKKSFIPKNQLMVNVKDYGALGDGITNDTVAIQSAINALIWGGIVYFPPGIYLSKKVSLNKNIEIRGSGIDTTIVKLMDNENTSLLEVIEKDYVTICNITIDGNCTNQTEGSPITFNKSRYNTIDKIKIINAHTIALNMTNVEKTVVKNSVFTGTINDVVVYIAYDGEGFNTGENSIVDCDIFNGKNGGIKYGMHYGNICRNRVHNNGSKNTTSGGIWAVNGEGIIIADNITYANNANGIMLMTCVNSSVKNNISYNNAFSGIAVWAVNKLIIQGNICRSNGTDTSFEYRNGIDLNWPCENITISDNCCCDDQNVKTQQWGIRVTDTDSNNIIISGNVCKDNVEVKGISMLPSQGMQYGNLPDKSDTQIFSLSAYESRELLEDNSKMAIIEIIDSKYNEYARFIARGTKNTVAELEDIGSSYQTSDDGSYYTVFFLNGVYVLRNKMSDTIKFQVKVTYLEQDWG